MRDLMFAVMMVMALFGAVSTGMNLLPREKAPKTSKHRQVQVQVEEPVRQLSRDERLKCAHILERIADDGNNQVDRELYNLDCADYRPADIRKR